MVGGGIVVGGGARVAEAAAHDDEHSASLGGDGPRPEQREVGDDLGGEFWFF